MKIISFGQKNNGQKTVQVVIVKDKKSVTKHLVQVYGNTYSDKDANQYEVK